jgi:NADPH-dependent glutamate synthase beta subunit-like oxidoreductase
MKNFEHVNAKTFEEASGLLAANPGKARAFSGGTDLLGECKDDILQVYPESVVNLKTIPGYGKLEETAGELVIGGGVTLAKLAGCKDYPAIAQAAHSVASPLIRGLATAGGNICQDVRCWYYRYPESVGGTFKCKRKGGETCYAIHGENRYHSIFGGTAMGISECKKACRAGTDVSAYMEKLRAGDWDGAAKIILAANPMPMFTSRVCPHPCQDSCNQTVYGAGVNIHDVERAVGDFILDHVKDYYKAPAKENGKKAAIIGSGPGGLAAAYYLRQAGFKVDVYEREKNAGGVLRYGIPHYRLPKHYIDSFVSALEGMGIAFKYGVNVGADIAVDKLKKDYDSLYFGTGAWKQPVLGIDGESLTEFGLNFLVEVNKYLKKAIGNKVLVCGGGNVAMDVALTAVRLGAKDVTLICLEQANEMPAAAEEVARAKEEGVKIFNGWGLSAVVTGADGKVAGLKSKRCVSVFDENHRFSPKYDENDTTVYNSDYIILATGQQVDISFLGAELGAQLKSSRGLIDADLETYKTKVKGIYAAGDVVTGPDLAIRAIAGGHAAALSIIADSGVSQKPADAPASFYTFDREGIAVAVPNKGADRPLGKRTLTDEDSSSLDKDAAVKEARRCMNCGCYAVNPSDLAPVLVMYDAELVTTKRKIKAAEFFGTTAFPAEFLQPGEVVKEIRVPKAKGVTAYDKVRIRDAIDFATVSLATRFVVEGGKIKEARIVFGSAAPTPYRLKCVEDFLVGKDAGKKTADEAAALAIKDVCVMAKNEFKVPAMASVLKDAILRAGK